ncbi:MAG TPA: FTR1 family protein [Hyphomicrobiaceae bacterium]
MTGAFWQVVFIIWRESVEALLVVGILNAWLTRRGGGGGVMKGRRFLWGGAIAGLAFAVVLGWALLNLADMLEGEALEWFQMAMVFAAAGLIVHMVHWMHVSGRTMKATLEGGAERALAAANWWGLFLLAALAVAREGSETVVFLYGVLAGSGGSASAPFVVGAVAGFVAAVITYALIQLGARRLSWSSFFRTSEIVLLLLAAALFIAGTDKAISLGLLPVLSGQLWDTSFILDDGRGWGGFIAALTGYRARPDLIWLIAYSSYWLAVFFLFRPSPVARPDAA